MAEEEGLLGRMRQFGQLVDLARNLPKMTTQQKRILAIVGGLGGGAAIIAALRNERFQELVKQAGDAAMEFTEETGRDAWNVLKQQVPELGARATQRFGENVINPFVGGIGDELAQRPLTE